MSMNAEARSDRTPLATVAPTADCSRLLRDGCPPSRAVPIEDHAAARAVPLEKPRRRAATTIMVGEANAPQPLRGPYSAVVGLALGVASARQRGCRCRQRRNVSWGLSAGAARAVAERLPRMGSTSLSHKLNLSIGRGSTTMPSNTSGRTSDAGGLRANKHGRQYATLFNNPHRIR